MSIPQLIQQAAAPETAVTETEAHELHGRRIYLIDDEIDIRRSMLALLRSWGMQAEAVNDADALDALFIRDGRPDVLIADLRLGDHEHGAALALQLRRLYGSFAVVIITGETQSSAMASALAAGFLVLQKPVSPEQLRSALSEVLHARPGTPDQAQREIASRLA